MALGTMVDCSRNAVPTVDSLKKWIDLTARLGYDTLLLYTEDTYEVDDNPYFGYMRGRFTQEELKEIDTYAVEKGLELIPCIQVLAHLGAIQRWPEYWPHFDAADILLVGEERIYGLIESIFATIDRCFTSKTIHLGMDEAHLLGRGRYFDRHGEKDRYTIMLDHLKRVCQIGEKYGFRFLMWSDMFFKPNAENGVYDSNVRISEEVKRQIPENVELVYWDYYSVEKSYYDKMLKTHEQIKKNTWFAGGMLSWAGFAPHNGYSIRINQTAIQSCRENGIQNMFFCLWGDCGGECSRFALLPTLVVVAELAKGNVDMDRIKEIFYEKIGISFDDFMLLDLPETPNGRADLLCNAEKYLFYNDYFTGLMDQQVTKNVNEKFAQCEKKLEKMCQQENWGYLFETQRALCHVLAVKADLSVRTRKAYEEQNKEALRKLILDYHEAEVRIQSFHEIYRKQWFKENKPHGFDVQDIRIGGLLARTRSCRERLEDYCSDVIDKIPELEEKQLDFFGIGTVRRQPDTILPQWEYMSSANLFTTVWT